MFHFTYAIPFVAAVFLILGVGLAVRAYLRNRREKVAPFRDYFGPEYDHDLLQQSAFSEAEDWRADPQTRFAPFRLRDPETSRRRTEVSGEDYWERESS
jgi:hypothetical protein